MKFSIAAALAFLAVASIAMLYAKQDRQINSIQKQYAEFQIQSQVLRDELSISKVPVSNEVFQARLAFDGQYTRLSESIVKKFLTRFKDEESLEPDAETPQITQFFFGNRRLELWRWSVAVPDQTSLYLCFAANNGAPLNGTEIASRWEGTSELPYAGPYQLKLGEGLHRIFWLPDVNQLIVDDVFQLDNRESRSMTYQLFMANHDADSSGVFKMTKPKLLLQTKVDSGYYSQLWLQTDSPEFSDFPEPESIKGQE